MIGCLNKKILFKRTVYTVCIKPVSVQIIPCDYALLMWLHSSSLFFLYERMYSKPIQSYSTYAQLAESWKLELAKREHLHIWKCI